MRKYRAVMVRISRAKAGVSAFSSARHCQFPRDLPGVFIRASAGASSQSAIGMIANAAGLAEVYNHDSRDSLVYLSLSNSVGGAILLGGRLYEGENRRAGEFGHTIVEPQGRPCPCGNLGCLEQYASETAILRKYNQLKNTVHCTIDDLVTDYQKKEGAALFAIQDFITYMAMGINNMTSYYNFENFKEKEIQELNLYPHLLL